MEHLRQQQVDSVEAEMLKDWHGTVHRQRALWHDGLASEAQFLAAEAGMRRAVGKASMRTWEEERLAAGLETYGGKNWQDGRWQEVGRKAEEGMEQEQEQEQKGDREGMGMLVGMGNKKVEEGQRSMGSSPRLGEAVTGWDWYAAGRY